MLLINKLKCEKMRQKEAIDLAKGAAAFLYEDDPEHFEGGCSDISEVIAIFLKNLGAAVKVVYGMAQRGRSSEAFAHAWLDILGERFDPTLWVFHEDLKRFRYKLHPKVEALIYCDLDPDEPYQMEQLERAYQDGQLTPERPELIEAHQPE